MSNLSPAFSLDAVSVEYSRAASRRATVMLGRTGGWLLGVSCWTPPPARRSCRWGRWRAPCWGSPSGGEAIVWSIRLPVALDRSHGRCRAGVVGRDHADDPEQPAGIELHAGHFGRGRFWGLAGDRAGGGMPVPEAYAIAAQCHAVCRRSLCRGLLIGGARNASAEGLVLAGIALQFLFQASHSRCCR
jgi:hypothetical protein